MRVAARAGWNVLIVSILPDAVALASPASTRRASFFASFRIDSRGDGQAGRDFEAVKGRPLRCQTVRSRRILSLSLRIRSFLCALIPRAFLRESDARDPNSIKRFDPHAAGVHLDRVADPGSPAEHPEHEAADGRVDLIVDVKTEPFVDVPHEHEAVDQGCAVAQ